MKTHLNKWRQTGLACLILIAGTGVGLGQGLLWTFNSSSDAAAWTDAGQVVTVTSSFIAGDAPPGQALSTGALGFQGTFGPGYGAAFGGLQVNIPGADADLSGYTDFSFWVKQEGTPDQYNQIQAIQINLQGNPGVYQTATYQPTYQGTGPNGLYPSNNGWEYFDVPMSDFGSANLTDIYQMHIYVVDGDYTAATPMNIAFDNMGFNIAPVPEPSSSLILLVGVAALGLTTLYRRKLCRLS